MIPQKILYAVALGSLFALILIGLSSEWIMFSKPEYNVLLISIDTLRADHLGLYGYEKNTSPFLDEFGEKSVVFENAFSQSSNTAPSHMSLFTGMYPERHGVTNIGTTLRENITTLTEVLKKNGYLTSFFVGDHPSISPKLGYRDIDEWLGNYSENKLDDDHALFGWLKKNNAKKFFAFVHMYHVHDPYLAPPPYYGKFTSRTPPWDSRENFINEVKQKGFLKNFDKERELYFSKFNISKKEDIQLLKDLYDEEILYTDNFLKQLVNEVKNVGIDDKTVIVITSDHGEEFMEHGEILHRQLYDEVIHIPLIIYHPQLEGQRIGGLVQSIDVFPTILKFLDIPPSQDIQGKSIVPLIKNGKEVNEYVYAHFEGFFSIRNETWKLFQKGENKELYNLEKDPLEQKNVAEQYQEVMQDLEEKMFVWRVRNLEPELELS